MSGLLVVAKGVAGIAKSVTRYIKCTVRSSLPWKKWSTHLYHTDRRYVPNAIVSVLRLRKVLLAAKEYALTFHHWNIFLDNEKSTSRHAVKFEVETRGKVGRMPDPWMQRHIHHCSCIIPIVGSRPFGHCCTHGWGRALLLFGWDGRQINLFNTSAYYVATEDVHLSSGGSTESQTRRKSPTERIIRVISGHQRWRENTRA